MVRRVPGICNEQRRRDAAPPRCRSVIGFTTPGRLRIELVRLRRDRRVAVARRRGAATAQPVRRHEGGRRAARCGVRGQLRARRHLPPSLQRVRAPAAARHGAAPDDRGGAREGPRSRCTETGPASATSPTSPTSPRPACSPRRPISSPGASSTWPAGRWPPSPTCWRPSARSSVSRSPSNVTAPRSERWRPRAAQPIAPSRPSVGSRSHRSTTAFEHRSSGIVARRRPQG